MVRKLKGCQIADPQRGSFMVRPHRKKSGVIVAPSYERDGNVVPLRDDAYEYVQEKN